MPDWLPFLHEIADSADEISLRFFRSRSLHVEAKADRTLVTEADLAVEEMARKETARLMPALGVFGEEQGEGDTAGRARLIIDPIDATANFARGVPVFATLLAVEDEGEIQAGLVSAPALHTRWFAARGAGAHRHSATEGKESIRVSGIRELRHAQLLHGSIAGQEGTKRSPQIVRLAQATHRQRGFGDFWQHALVAEGSGEIALDPIVAPWDIAALQVLVEEAGGRATSVKGERSIYAGSLVTSNGLLHDAALSALAAD